MLVRQIAMPCSLIIPLGVWRIDHPVLLIEHDITGNEPSADLKDFVVSGKLKEQPLINQRQPNGVVFVDCLKRLSPSVFGSVTLLGAFECFLHGVEPARFITAVDNSVAKMP